ncbi:hypothetical protein [Paraglaciecola aestuariivivens]
MPKVLRFLPIAIVAIISELAGLAKLLQAPDEVAFLQTFGLSTSMIVFYGLFQILAGALITLPRSRRIGADMAILAFALATGFLVASGNYTFAVVSLLPIGLSGWISYQTRQ